MSTGVVHQCVDVRDRESALAVEIENSRPTRHGREGRIVKRRRMHEDLVEMLATDIREGVYTVGDALPSERDLMDEFGVSRLTVREATAALESKGLIETRPGTRARVCGPRPDFLLGMLSEAAAFHLGEPGGLRSFMEIRGIVETGVARIAAERITDEQIEGLKSELGRNRKAVGDMAEFGRTDVEFHSAIARIVENPIVDGFFIAVDEWLREVRRTSLLNDGQMETAYAAHVRIFAALELRDPDRASAEMREHLGQLSRIYPPTPVEPTAVEPSRKAAP
ncbi:MAG TPA: FCD domain-containing protein [Aurantimonas coralicida]|uniref:FCD domain-containing protein n=1 Tax=Aurantimonas coralicida TaxID=182270 RepID=A0A9C9NG33_9HYPH|nr:FCD domain-containing protein [Aurantimonas coralicida]HEU00624.1 FCD domain-containing protein [Aurantimonas coralicida]